MYKVLLLVFFIATLPIQAGIWGSRGASHAFELRDGGLLYVADGRGLSLYDVSDPQKIRLLDLESGDRETRDLAFMGEDRLVVATAGGLEWFRVVEGGGLERQGVVAEAGSVEHVAATPTVVAAGGVSGITFYLFEEGTLQAARRIATKDAVNDLVFVDGLLYAGFHDGGVAIYSPSSAQPLDRFGIERPSFSLQGDILWIAAGQSGLWAFDVSTAADPRLIVARAGTSVRPARQVVASGSRAWVVRPPDQVVVYDISDPELPRELTTISEWVDVVAASETRLYLSGTVVDTEGLTRSTGLPVRVFDVPFGEAPRLAGEYRDLAGPLSGVATNGTLAWVADPPYFRVIDVSRSDTPRELASIAVEDIQDSVRVRDGIAIIYGRGLVNIIDVSDLYNPRHIGTWDALGHPPSAAALLNDAIVEANEHSGLHILDYSDPAHPVQTTGRIMHYHDVVAGDDAVYALLQSAFLTADVSNRRQLVDRLIVTETFLRLESVPPSVGFPEYLVTQSETGLDVWTLRPDRFAPRRLYSVPASGLTALATSQNRAFLAGHGTLWSVEIPAGREMTDTTLPVTSPLQIAAAGEKVVVADRYSLRVYGPDTDPPPDPPVPPVSRRRAVRK